MKKEKTSSYKVSAVVYKYRQWYSNDFKGSFATIKEFRDYINGRIGRGNLKAL